MAVLSTRRRWASPLMATARRAVDERRPVLTLLRLLPRATRWGSLLLATDVVSSALVPVAGTLAFALVVVTVMSSSRTSLSILGMKPQWAALGAVSLVFLLERCVLPFLSAAHESCAHRVNIHVRERVLRAVLRPADTAHLDDAEIADELRLAGRVGTEAYDVTRTLSALVAISSARLLACLSAVVLGLYAWWAPPPLVAAWVLSRGWYRAETRSLIASMERSASELRRAEYFADLTFKPPAAKELRVFGVGGWVLDRFRRSWLSGMQDVWEQRRLRGGAMVRSTVVLLAAHAFVLVMLVRSVIDGGVAVIEFIVFLQVALGVAGFAWDADNEYLLALGTASLPHGQKIEKRLGSPRPPAGARRVPSLGSSIRLEKVWFRYPGGDHDVLRGLDLVVPAGRSLAIVGSNGAGKTTLVNLLAGFIQPTAGGVLVDGVDLRDLDATSWQRRFALVLQDFGRYPLSLHDNVVFGAPGHADDLAARDRVAVAAGLDEVVAQLPQGWDTPLSRRFAGGVDLSGGQWQRVAFARALFAAEHGADVLVLDEPTANLDVRAEAAFYDHFVDITRGLTTILISHRFSTVRWADQIVVLDRGRIAEAGSHDQLMEKGGRYQRMFCMQAALYLEDGRG